VQQDLHGRRARTWDPLYAARRTMCTGDVLLTDKRMDLPQASFADEEHLEVEATGGRPATYQPGSAPQSISTYPFEPSPRRPSWAGC
jgi:hypothetical protein